MTDRRLTNHLGLLTIFSCVAFLSPGKGGAQDSAQEVVGEITTVIGQGIIRNPTGDYPVTRGQRIRAGDRIETAEGGHVHIRFVDGGLVSVRPLSRLLVEEYHDTRGGNLAAIKFQLEEGVVRSVTGKWGETSRDRFRLNTPIAAIGVKGTDFVVKVEQGKTFASVIFGAIVMAPLEGPCVDSLGPCQSESAALLSADMQGQMLEYLQKDGGRPRLVPSVDLLVRNRVNLPQNAVADKARSSAADALAESQKNQQSLPVSVSKPLVWLHNQMGWGVPANTISERYDDELAAGRTPVVGSFFTSLYRDETLQSVFQPQQPSASFNLTSASANFVAHNRLVEPVQVSNAALNVDFARATFVTQMQLNSPSLGTEQLQASGSVNSRGVFVANGGTQSLAGAFSLDGKQAGYLFNKTVTTGNVSGLTLWGR